MFSRPFPKKCHPQRTCSPPPPGHNKNVVFFSSLMQILFFFQTRNEKFQKIPSVFFPQKTFSQQTKGLPPTPCMNVNILGRLPLFVRPLRDNYYAASLYRFNLTLLFVFVHYKKGKSTIASPVSIHPSRAPSKKVILSLFFFPLFSLCLKNTGCF